MSGPAKEDVEELLDYRIKPDSSQPSTVITKPPPTITSNTVVVSSDNDNGNDDDSGGGNVGIKEGYVTIAVGTNGVEFRHDIYLLRSGSEYFDAMFRHNMKESNERRIEFPDDEPREWNIIAPFLNVGVATPEINTGNVEIILRWSERLCLKSDSIKESCDQVYCKVFQTDLKQTWGNPSTNSEKIATATTALRLACRFNLPSTKRKSIRILQRYLGGRATIAIIAGMACGNLFDGDADEERALLDVYLRESTCYRNALRKCTTHIEAHDDAAAANNNNNKVTTFAGLVAIDMEHKQFSCEQCHYTHGYK